MERQTLPPNARTADRLSALPDDLLKRILAASDLDVRTAAQTSSFSRRWRSVWKTCFTKFEIRIPPFVDECNRYTLFMENLLSFRSEEKCADLEVLSLTTQLITPHMFDLLRRIFDHAVACKVRTLRLDLGWAHWSDDQFPPGLASLCGSVENLEISTLRAGDLYKLRDESSGNYFSALRTLRLYRCVLTPCHAPGDEDDDDARGHYYDPFGSIPNLNRLEVVDCGFVTSDLPILIAGAELVDLVVVCRTLPGGHLFSPPEIEIDGPKVKNFTCRYTRGDVVWGIELPSLECLDVDIYLNREMSLSEQSMASIEAFHFFRKFTCGDSLKRVKLHRNIIKALTLHTRRLNREPSPFNCIDCVELHNSTGADFLSNARKFNHLLGYFYNAIIRGNRLFKHTFVPPGTTGDGSSRPMVVHRSDLIKWATYDTKTIPFLHI